MNRHDLIQFSATMTDYILQSMIPQSVQNAFNVSIRTATKASGGFSGATVFRAMTNDQCELAVRCVPKSVVLPSQRLRELYELLSTISKRGCPIIPVPILSVASSGITPSPDFSEDKNTWQMEPWMPGAPKVGNEMGDLHLTAALLALHQFHKHASESLQELGPGEWYRNVVSRSPAVQRRLEIVTQLREGILSKLRVKLSKDPDERFRKLAICTCESLHQWLPWLHSELKVLAAIQFPLQPVLRDIWRAHVLFSEDRVTGLIDLSAAGSDHVTLDVTRLLRSWYGSDARRIRNALQEYQSIRPLDLNEHRLVQALDAATVLLSPVTWLRRRFESGDASPFSMDVIERMTELTKIASNFHPLFANTDSIRL